MKLNIQLGSNFNTNYVVAITTAPKAYDGFGTIDLAPTYLDSRDARLVLIQERHEGWQLARYSSGIYATDTTELHCGVTEEILVEELYKRLIGKEVTE